MKKSFEIFLGLFLIGIFNILIFFDFYPTFFEEWVYICPLDEPFACAYSGILLFLILLILQFIILLPISIIAIYNPKRRRIMIMIIGTLISSLIILTRYLRYFF